MSQPPGPEKPSILRKVSIPFLLIAILGVVGLLTFLYLYETAFPTASIDFQIGRGEALEMAQEFWRRQGHDLSDYRSAVTFRADHSAKNYIDQQAGPATLNRLAKEEISIWRWRVRFFAPLQKEEFGTTFDPSSRLVGFYHAIPEEEPGAKLDAEAAQRLVEHYLREAHGLDLSGYNLVDSSSHERDDRVDHYFTWERRDFKIGEATYRLHVGIQGDEISSYWEGLKIPEAWFIAQHKESERGGLLGTIGSTFNFVLSAAMAVTFLLQMRAGLIRWRFAISLALIVVIILAVAGLNDLPLRMADYPTTSSLAGYIIQYLLSGLLGLAYTGVMIALQGSTGESLARGLWPKRIPLTRFITRRGLRSREVVAAIIVGYFLAAFQLGYVMAFYRLGQDHFRVWVPVDIPYDDILSTVLPWIYPMTVGASAAINEESFFRLFSGSLVKRYLRVRWLAALVPGVIWASLHALYPQQPFFIRVVELSVIGFILGLVFLRYGVLATITSHYLYNAIVSGSLVWETGELYPRLAMAFVIALPALMLLPAAISLLRRRKLLSFEDFPQEEKVVVPTLPSTVAPPTHREIVPLTKRALAIAGILALLGMVLIIAFPTPHLGDFLDVGIGRGEAQGIAIKHLTELELPTQDFHMVSDFTTLVGGDTPQYLIENLGVEGAERFLESQLPTYGWHVRFWKPEKKEEIRVWVDPSGQPIAMSHTLEEEASGANLKVEEAQEIAENFLDKFQGIPLAECELADSSSQEREARTDHYFTWERKDQPVGEGALRHYVTVQGERIGAYGSYLKITEAWQREQDKWTAWRAIVSGTKSYLPMGLTFLCLILFVLRFRVNKLNLRFALIVALAMTLLDFLGRLNNLSTFFLGYRHTQSLADYLIRYIVGFPQGLAYTFGYWYILGGLAEALYREAFTEEAPIPLRLSRWRKWSSAGWREATLLCLLAYLLWRGAMILDGWVRAALAPSSMAGPRAPIGLLDPFLPTLAALTGSLSSTLYYCAILALVVSLLRRYLKRPAWIGPLLVLAAVAWNCIGAESWAELAVEGIVTLLMALGIWWLVGNYFRHNVWAYLAAGYTAFMLEDSLNLIGYSYSWYVLNGWLILVLALLPCLVAVTMHLRFRERG
jgi:hypothetical protein